MKSKREIRVYLSFSYAKYQGLCSCGAIFLRTPTVSELPSALLEMRTLFLGFASKATLALLLMVHQEKRETRVSLFFVCQISRTLLLRSNISAHVDRERAPVGFA